MFGRSAEQLAFSKADINVATFIQQSRVVDRHSPRPGDILPTGKALRDLVIGKLVRLFFGPSKPVGTSDH